MSLRYTGEATMDEPALRDVERWKDKIEVRLDNRQVFFLFFGSAMVACMLFVLGVIVGKRLETRGHAEAPAVEDPLAVLDRFGVAAPPAAQAPTTLAFPRALIGGGTGDKAKGGMAMVPLADRPERASRAERIAVKPLLATTVPSLPVAPIAAPRLAPLPKPAPVALAAPATAPAPVAPAPTAAPSVPAPVAASRKLAALPRPLPGAADKVKTIASAVAKESAQPAKSPAQPAKLASLGVAKPAPAPAAGDRSKGRFLLQLSSFQDRAEADAFARRFGAQNAYVVATEIPGKGTWYRVRVGSYASMQEATVAKAAFEHDHNVIAYVAGGGAAK